MTKRTRLRTSQASSQNDEAARPAKIKRVAPPTRGLTRDNPIVLGSDDEVTSEMDFPLGQQVLDSNGFSQAAVNNVRDSMLRPADLTRRSPSSEVEELVSSPTKLFYHEPEVTTRKFLARRSLAILAKEDAAAGAPPTTPLRLSSGWHTPMPNHVVNLFLEGKEFENSTFARFSHLHVPDGKPTDLETIRMSDLRKELARILNLDDVLSLQLEVQYAHAVERHGIFHGGSCSRLHAPWKDVTVDDRSSLSTTFAQPSAWIRVRVADYLQITVPSRDMTIAITPSSNATARDIREIVALKADISPSAVSLFADYAEISDSMGRLWNCGLKPGTNIMALIETRECANCLDDVGANDFPFQPTTNDCFHDLDICKQCINTWITTSLDNGNWKNISCLSANCGAVLQYPDLKRIGSTADMDRYERFATRDAFAQIPGFKWCLNNDCDAGQIHDDGGGNEQILTCEVCQFKRCMSCDREWHQDETCNEYTQRLAAQPRENDASEAWVASNSRKCPGCQSPIQKNDGCDHMTCTRCRRQFCWICQADYKDIRQEGNSAHRPDCRYHSGNIIDPHAPPRQHAPPLPRPVVIPRAPRQVRNVHGNVENNNIVVNDRPGFEIRPGEVPAGLGVLEQYRGMFNNLPMVWQAPIVAGPEQLAAQLRNQENQLNAQLQQFQEQARREQRRFFGLREQLQRTRHRLQGDPQNRIVGLAAPGQAMQPVPPAVQHGAGNNPHQVQPAAAPQRGPGAAPPAVNPRIHLHRNDRPVVRDRRIE